MLRWFVDVGDHLVGSSGSAVVARLRSLGDRQRCLRGGLDFASSVRVGLLQAVLLFLRLLNLLISPLLAHNRRFRRLFVDRMVVLVLMWRRHHFSSYLLLAFVSSCNGPGVGPRLSLGRHILRLDHNGLLLGDCYSR